jgi:hypothetical protein
MACAECAEKIAGFEKRADELADSVAEVRAELAAVGKLTRSTGWLTVAVAFAVLYLVWGDGQAGKVKAAET